MHRWRSLVDIPPGYGPSVVTMGNFDGVHRGHQAVLGRVVRLARERGAHAVAVTFDPHPVAVLHPERAPRQLTGLDHRLDLMARTGLDGVLVMEFTRELAQQTPEEFVRLTFVEGLAAAAVVVGVDTRFGLHNSGDIDTMRALGERLGFDVVALQPVGEHCPVDADVHKLPRSWSSTRLRGALAAGQVAVAAEVLGRPHRVTGTVVHGHHRGRGLGFPTANLGGDAEGMVPADGVYAGWLDRLELPADHPDRRMPAAVSVGTNPTFDDVPERTVEAHVLGRCDLDLYGERVGVDFVQWLRGNVRFDSVDDLLRQMRRDVEDAHDLLC